MLLDPQGRYILLVCKLFSIEFILGSVYIPPPYNGEVIRQIGEFLIDNPGMPLLIVGDFNSVCDPSRDRYLAGPQGDNSFS